MFNDVVDLREFYADYLGQVARRMIRRRVRRIWPNVRDEVVLGLGYATPYLRPFQEEAERVLAVMPAQQGVMRWPYKHGNLTALADEGELPFQDVSVDKILLVHAVECSEQLRPMLDEVWRVLKGNGRLLVVVPNRTGLWARFEKTPFGHGHPYSQSQLSRLLRDAMFTPVQSAQALFSPPYSYRWLIKSTAALENVGERWFPRLSGVVMIEATKQIYATREKHNPVLARTKALIARQRPATANRDVPYLNFEDQGDLSHARHRR